VRIVRGDDDGKRDQGTLGDDAEVRWPTIRAGTPTAMAPGGEIAGDHGPGPDHAAVRNGDAAEHGDARAEPDISAQAGGFEDVGLRANRNAEGRQRVFRGENAGVHRDQAVVADLDAPVPVNDDAGAEVNANAETDRAAVRSEDHAGLKFATGADFKTPSARVFKSQPEVACGSDRHLGRDSGSGRPRAPDPRGGSPAVEAGR
jgi:hypothetical protein